MSAQSPFDRLSARLGAAAQLLASNPNDTATRAREILAAAPGQQQALFLLTSAYRTAGDTVGAREALAAMAETHPELASIQFELGSLLASLGLWRDAITPLSRVVELEPNHPSGWRVLATQFELSGDRAAAAAAWRRHISVSVRELKLLEDAAAGSKEDVAKAENMLRQCLAVAPTDIMTIRMLAQREVWHGQTKAAAMLLENALWLEPDLVDTRREYAAVLQQEMKWRESNEQLDAIIQANPDDAISLASKASNLVMLGDYEQAFVLLESIPPELTENLSYWLSYGHTLRTVGRSAAAVEAYRKCLKLDPACGFAWWSLANLKTYRFSTAEIGAMREELQNGEDLGDEVRCHLEFSLGKALEDAGAYADSFEHYRQGNALRRPRVQYDATIVAARVARTKALFTPEFFNSRVGLGCMSADPILIVGMPRAGSTLVEQILSSHSAVEGTAELPDLPEIVWDLKYLRENLDYPEILAELDAGAWKRLGEQYLQTTRAQRKLAKPFFTDKAPGNFQYVGLIDLILPNAKIIDARRHPMACSFSGYKQCFQMGSMPHTYDLAEAGHYYRMYVEIMAHYDRVLPRRIYRIFHEDLVRDPETEIRRLLDYCGLPFEESCLRFHETQRGVRTSSSQQVRQPIYAPAIEPWRHYEEWLAPLKSELGDVLALYPAVPEF